MYSQQSCRIQAQFVVVDSTTILPEAQLVIRSGVIEQISQSSAQQADVRLEGTTLLPGFINAHTHLEFSDLKAPFPAGTSFPEWISQVVRHRQGQAQQAQVSDSLLMNRMHNIFQGLIECQQAGTAVVVDIVTQPWSLDGLTQAIATSNSNCKRSHLPRVLALTELIGMDSSRLQASWQWARQQLAECESLTTPSARQSECHPVIEIGISPHATYSLAQPLISNLLRSVDKSRLVAMHVAESLEEIEWAESATGPFRDLFSRLGLGTSVSRLQIDKAIDLLSGFRRALLIHGNYLGLEQLNRIAASSIGIVYCPRTHAHFGHIEYPLDEIVARGIPLMLGTDSRASNPDLSIWKECCWARRQHPDWTAAQSLAAITTVPAKFLGLEEQLGSLRVGRWAVINSVTTPQHATKTNLLEMLQASANQPVPLVL